MDRIHNKDGPGFDENFPITERPRDRIERRPRDGIESQPRDGTENKPRDGIESQPRDGTERKPRDGTERRARDGTERKPRNKTMLQTGSKVIKYYYRITGQPKQIGNCSKPSSRRRKIWWGQPAIWTGMGEVCPVVNETINIVMLYYTMN